MPSWSPLTRDASTQPWTSRYTSFGRDGPYPQLNKSPIDRSPLAARCVVTKSGLIARPDHVPGYPIGMRLQDLRSDFGVEDERKDWLHKPNYGQVPPYLAKVNKVRRAEEESMVSSPRMVAHETPRRPGGFTIEASTSSSPRGQRSPRVLQHLRPSGAVLGQVRRGHREAAGGVAAPREHLWHGVRDARLLLKSRPRASALAWRRSTPACSRGRGWPVTCHLVRYRENRFAPADSRHFASVCRFVRGIVRDGALCPRAS